MLSAREYPAGWSYSSTSASFTPCPAQLASRRFNALQEARIVLQSVIEPLVFRSERHEEARRENDLVSHSGYILARVGWTG